MRKLLVLGGLCCSAMALAGPQLLSLSDAEHRAIANSLEMKEAEARIGMANAGKQAQQANASPRLSIEGNYRYVSEVPEVKLGPQEVQLGQHHNASLGPTLSYELYDGGVESKATASAESLVHAEEKDRSGMRLRVLMATRMAYAAAQMGIEELHLVQASLKVSETRLKDARQRLQAGSASRLELLAAQREEAQLKVRLNQAQINLDESQRHLGTLLGITPFPSDTRLDAMDQTLTAMKRGVTKAPNIQHPSLKAWDDRLDAARLMAESRDQQSRPKIQAFARSSYDYPNGPVDESVWQNSVGVSVSLTLFDGGLRQGLAAQKTAEAQINAMKKSQIQRDFLESWDSSQSKLDQMQIQATILTDSIQRSQQEAELTLVNYQAGTANYLEVQRADNQVLEARTALLRLKAQMIGQWATLNYLSAPTEVKP